MPKYSTDDIRNVAIVGHSGSGKTCLAEAMLHVSGAIPVKGTVDSGTTVSDHLPQAKEMKKSISTSIMHCNWAEKEINLIDTPGYSDFIGGMYSALSAVETALVAVNSVIGVEVNTRKAWNHAGKLGCSRVIVITKMDSESADFDRALSLVKEQFGPECVPVVLPAGEGFDNVVNLLDPESAGGEFEAQRNDLIESAVSADDELLEKYLEEESLPEEELASAVTSAIASGSIVPVIAVSAEKEVGIRELLDFLAKFGAGPKEAKKRRMTAEGEAGEPEEIDVEGPLSGQVFKVMSDEYVGKVSFIRVYSGQLAAGNQVACSTTRSPEKIPKLFRFQGGKQEEVSAAVAGDIVATAKVEALDFGATVGAGTSVVPFAAPEIPTPMVARAIAPKARGDEGRISEAMRKLADEDPTLVYVQERQTKELVVTGMGEQHLRVVFQQLKSRFNVDVETRPPKIPYRETVTSIVSDVEYTHKKQTGGAGQYARVIISIEPLERGEGYEFVDEIFGGSIDQPFRSSVDKGIKAASGGGVLAGYPVVDFRVRLVDGKTHPVDSKDIAFQIAGREAFKLAFMNASPVLLEPIVNMEVVAPAEFMGDITGDMSSRRGRVLGVDSLGDMQVVKAQVPAAEVQMYGSQLQSITGGRGEFTMELSHYDVVPENVAQQVIKARKKADEK